MDFTYTVSVQLGLSPFAVMEEDKDRVIMLINYYIEKAEKPNETKQTAMKQKNIPRRYDDFWNF